MRTSYHIFRNWGWEISSIVTAIGIIIAIAALLATYDGKPTPDWGERINFNALLAVLSTILRAMLVVVVSQVISQRKWVWFGAKSERPLSDMQRFDAGSRGSFGAVLLLPTVVFKDLITATAGLVLFASFLVGPAIQQASRTMDCTIVAKGANALIPFAHYVPRRGGYIQDYTGAGDGPAPDITATVLSAIMAPDGIENRISTSCSTGNCTFPFGDPLNSTKESPVGSDDTTHTTAAMCTKCIDVSPLAVRVSTNCTFGTPHFVLPGNFSIGACAGIPTIARLGSTDDLAWTGEFLTPEMRAVSRWAYINATFLTLSAENSDKPNNRSVFVTVCSLYPCTRTYLSSINDGVLSETEVASSPMQVNASIDSDVSSLTTLYNKDAYYTAVQSPCRIDDNVYDIAKNMSQYSNGTHLELSDFVDYGESEPYNPVIGNITAPEQCIYRQNPDFVIGVSQLLSGEIFEGTCTNYRVIDCHRWDPGVDTQTSSKYKDLGATTVITALYSDGYGTLTNVTKWFESFAATMTNRFRIDYGSELSSTTPDRKRIERPLERLQGLAWQNTTCVSMRSSWLLLPICLTAITAFLVIWTIATTWRHRRTRPVWKDGILPLIFYAREFLENRPAADSQQPFKQDVSAKSPDPRQEDGKLLETKDMMKISDDIGLTLRHLYKERDATGVELEDAAPSRSTRLRFWRKSKADEETARGQLLAGSATARSNGEANMQDFARTGERTKAPAHVYVETAMSFEDLDRRGYPESRDSSRQRVFGERRGS